MSNRAVMCGVIVRRCERDSAITPGTVCMTTSNGGRAHNASAGPIRDVEAAVFELTSTSTAPPR